MIGYIIVCGVSRVPLDLFNYCYSRDFNPIQVSISPDKIYGEDDPGYKTGYGEEGYTVMYDVNVLFENLYYLSALIKGTYMVETYGEIEYDNNKNMYTVPKIRIIKEMERDDIYKLIIDNNLVNDLRWSVRALAAKYGAWLDKFVDDDDYRVRREVAIQGYGLDKLINDVYWEVRNEVARRHYRLDILIHDEDPNVRATVAQEGYGLEILVNDDDYYVRETVARKGYGLDILINDANEYVRKEVANHCYGLDILINDPHWRVRKEVAKQGYGLDILINDTNPVIRAEVAKKRYKLDVLMDDPNPIVWQTAISQNRAVQMIQKAQQYKTDDIQ